MSKIKSGNSKKIGRNKVKCASYKASGQREKNRDKRIAKIIKGLSKNGKDYKVIEKNDVLNIVRV